jgi:hypothetical protein
MRTFDEPLAKEFTTQVTTAARAKFGEKNVTGIENQDGIGSFLINLNPDKPRGLLGTLNDLHITMVMTTPQSMDVHFLHGPALNDRMFYHVLRHMTGTDARPGVGLMKVNTTESTPISRQFKVSGLEVAHLTEQARFVVDALHGGIAAARAEPAF